MTLFFFFLSLTLIKCGCFIITLSFFHFPQFLSFLPSLQYLQNTMSGLTDSCCNTPATETVWANKGEEKVLHVPNHEQQEHTTYRTGPKTATTGIIGVYDVMGRGHATSTQFYDVRTRERERGRIDSVLLGKRLPRPKCQRSRGSVSIFPTPYLFFFILYTHSVSQLPTVDSKSLSPTSSTRRTEFPPSCLEIDPS